jgi:hypothetical protein
MKSHDTIDRRSLALARAVVAVIDADPLRKGLQTARNTCARWLESSPSPVIGEWQAILRDDWSSIRVVLLDGGEEGRRLRQSSPFCGILSNRERWTIYRQFQHEPQAA